MQKDRTEERDIFVGLLKKGVHFAPCVQLDL
jgi:hypothetical protein